MVWILTIGLQLGFLAAGILRAEQAGVWSWSMFFFALGFAAIEIVVGVVPAMTLDLHSRGYWWIVGAGWLVAALNFVWFIVICRRWKPTGGGSGQSR